VKFNWIQAHQGGSGSGTGSGTGDWPVAAMCDVLGVSRSGYYAWRDRPASAAATRRAELAAQVKAAHADSRGAYGSPRVAIELQDRGVAVCENTVAKVMREQGIRSVAARRFRCRTTDAAHAHPVAENLLLRDADDSGGDDGDDGDDGGGGGGGGGGDRARDFTADAPDRKWAADVTYVRTGQGWLYVAAVIDLCTRRVVGWAMADHLRAELCTDALAMALARRRPDAGGAGLVHHSDRGCQYACGAYRDLLASRGIACSMSRSGDCYDNAVVESFWSTLKRELVHHADYATRAQATAAIFEWVECWYNRKRRHSALDYKSPEEFEAGLN
jgi:transposase InsO family protein